MPTIHNLISWGETILANANVASPRVDAEWILIHVLCGTRSDLVLRARETLTDTQIQTFQDLIATRAQRVPLQHLLGETEFYGLPLCVTPDALIPRPDTETLVECVLNALRDTPAPRVLDIGTGTGAIAIAIAHARTDAQVFATDISQAALDLARKNARRNAQRVHFLRANLLSAIVQEPLFHAIVSNPPYIPTTELKTLEIEVRNHDPHLALDGGPDGLDYYRTIIPAAVPRLRPKGILAFEMGSDQSDSLCALIQNCAQLAHPHVLCDLSRLPRVVLAQRCG
jgi:release factor glutamine methyltransferase